VRRVLTIAAAVLAAFLLQVSIPARGQVGGYANCAERAAALSQLSKAYGEHPVAIGLASSGGVIEVLASQDGASWSIVVTLPSGLTCLVASGEGWRRIEVKPGEES